MVFYEFIADETWTGDRQGYISWVVGVLGAARSAMLPVPFYWVCCFGVQGSMKFSVGGPPHDSPFGGTSHGRWLGSSRLK